MATDDEECTHESWEELGGGARRCADCKASLPKLKMLPPLKVGDLTYVCERSYLEPDAETETIVVFTRPVEKAGPKTATVRGKRYEYVNGRYRPALYRSKSEAVTAFRARFERMRDDGIRTANEAMSVIRDVDAGNVFTKDQLRERRTRQDNASGPNTDD